MAGDVYSLLVALIVCALWVILLWYYRPRPGKSAVGDTVQRLLKPLCWLVPMRYVVKREFPLVTVAPSLFFNEDACPESGRNREERRERGKGVWGKGGSSRPVPPALRLSLGGVWGTFSFAKEKGPPPVSSAQGSGPMA